MAWRMLPPAGGSKIQNVAWVLWAVLTGYLGEQVAADWQDGPLCLAGCRGSQTACWGESLGPARLSEAEWGAYDLGPESPRLSSSSHTWTLQMPLIPTINSHFSDPSAVSAGVCFLPWKESSL